jgi:hypothetical protein
MQTNLIRDNAYRFLLPSLIGIIIFIWFTGGTILDPKQIDWIIGHPGDPAQHYMGWQAFRHAPMLQWPFGLDKNYGEALGASIVFSDSLPLFAIPFKLFRSFLPADFQYMGLWILLCFILQAVFASELISKFSNDRRVILLGAGLLTLSPAMLWRLYGHEALIGHWAILAGLNFYFSDRRKWLKWAILLCIVSWVHAYLFVMTASIWGVDVLRHRSKSRSQMVWAASAFGTLASVVFCMWFAGYFIGGSVTGGGFGEFRTNLLSFFNPHDAWSILGTGAVHGGDYEGFAYLGLGNIALIAFAIYAFVRNRKTAYIDRKVVKPLMILCALMFLYALSNRVIAGSHELFHYPLPKFLHRFTDTFRCSGRFIWPVIYMLEGTAIFLIVRLVSPMRTVGFLAACLLIQVVDISRAPDVFKHLWNTSAPQVLPSAFWTSVQSKYRRVAIVPPVGNSILPITLWALTNDMSINEVDRARLGGSDLEAAQQEVISEIEQRRFRADTIYIFRNKTYLPFVTANATEKDFVGVVDGYYVLAPNRDCMPACAAQSGSTWATDTPTKAITSFAVDGNSDELVAGGWSEKEPAGRWTDGHHAKLSLFVGKLGTPVRVQFEMNAFTHAEKVSQRVAVSINGRHVADWTIGAGASTQEVLIDPVDVDKTKGFAELSFQLPDAISPVDAGLSSDTRMLGVFVRNMTIFY